MRPLGHVRPSEDELRERAAAFRRSMSTRRSVREFSPDPVPLDVLRDLVAIAASAPSGAHKQPWSFVLVTDPAVKQQIREAAEEEEREFYGRRAPERWLKDLEPFGTDAHKPFLEVAPALIVVFAQIKGQGEDEKHYYVKESVGIASGFLIAAIHQAGLVTLTHTPSPMDFLAKILGRPRNERAFLLLPVGYPAEGAVVPDISRKPLDAVLFEQG